MLFPQPTGPLMRVGVGEGGGELQAAASACLRKRGRHAPEVDAGGLVAQLGQGGGLGVEVLLKDGPVQIRLLAAPCSGMSRRGGGGAIKNTATSRAFVWTVASPPFPRPPTVVPSP